MSPVSFLTATYTWADGVDITDTLDADLVVNQWLIATLKTDTSVKTVRRNKISETHDILILAGDNIGDFDELFEDRKQNSGFETVDAHKADFGKRFIILPNPMYGSWERVSFKGQKGLSPKEKNDLRKEALFGYKELAK